MAKKKLEEMSTEEISTEETNTEEAGTEEVKASSAPLYVAPKIVLSESERRNLFKMFWAQTRKQYGKPKDLEEIIWVHLKAIGKDQPETFEIGIAHFGLKKIK